MYSVEHTTFFCREWLHVPVKLESFLWYLSITVIVIISLYVFYGYFSGEMSGFGAFTLLLVTYAAFGFMLGVAAHLAGQRKDGWTPEEEWSKRAGGSRSVPRSDLRSESVLSAFTPRARMYGKYRKVLLILIAAGMLLILESPALGLVVVCIAAVSYVVLRAVELFDNPAED